jgi:hypothetical protein
MKRYNWKRRFGVIGVILGLECLGLVGFAVTGQGGWFVYMFAVMFPFMYFFPTLWAWFADKPNLVSTFFINLFVGWSLVGWFVLIVYLSMQPSAGRDPRKLKATRANRPILSPDGYYFWDGIAWRPVPGR